jgi:hypothetical protein
MCLHKSAVAANPLAIEINGVIHELENMCDHGAALLVLNSGACRESVPYTSPNSNRNLRADTQWVD